MITISMGKISFNIREFQDFSWLNEIGKVVYVEEEKEKGFVLFGLENGNEKYCIQYAGADLEETEIKSQKAIEDFKQILNEYRKRPDGRYVRFIRQYETPDGIAAILKWKERKKKWSSQAVGIEH